MNAYFRYKHYQACIIHTYIHIIDERIKNWLEKTNKQENQHETKIKTHTRTIETESYKTNLW